MEQEQKFSFELSKFDTINICLNFTEDWHSLLFTFENPESGEKKEFNISPINNGWISVKERLPEDEQRVLCYSPYEGELVLRYFESKNTFIDLEDCWHDIDYWQPLPKPPKED